jgi:hypothetical protein
MIAPPIPVQTACRRNRQQRKPRAAKLPENRRRKFGGAGNPAASTVEIVSCSECSLLETSTQWSLLALCRLCEPLAHIHPHTVSNGVEWIEDR